MSTSTKKAALAALVATAIDAACDKAIESNISFDQIGVAAENTRRAAETASTLSELIRELSTPDLFGGEDYAFFMKVVVRRLRHAAA